MNRDESDNLVESSNSHLKADRSRLHQDVNQLTSIDPSWSQVEIPR